MAVAALAVPVGVGVFKLAKKFLNAADSLGDVGKASKVARNADSAKAIAKSDGIGCHSPCGVLGTSEYANSARSWQKATFDTPEDSLKYHFNKHVAKELGSNPLRLGSTPAEYTADAQKFWKFNKNSPLREPITLMDGTPGVRIRHGGGLPGGIFTPEGKIVTFWYAGK